MKFWGSISLFVKAGALHVGLHPESTHLPVNRCEARRQSFALDLAPNS
jgi:hypothetical protein